MDILNTIDEINSCNSENELCVAESLVVYYDKLLSIIEYSDQPLDQTLSIFQEGKIMDDVKKQGEGQSGVQKVFTFLFRFIKSVIKAIKGKLSTQSVKVSKPDIVEKNPKLKVALETAKSVVKAVGIPVLFVGGTYVTIEEYLNHDRMSLKERARNIVNIKERFNTIKWDHEISKYEKENKEMLNSFAGIDLLKKINFDAIIKPVTWGIKPSGEIIYTDGFENIIFAYNRLVDGARNFLFNTSYLGAGSFTKDTTDPVEALRLSIRGIKLKAVRDLKSSINLVYRLLVEKSREDISGKDLEFAGNQFNYAENKITENDTKFKEFGEEELQAFKDKYNPSDKMLNDMANVVRAYYDDLNKTFNEINSILVKWKKAILDKFAEIDKSMSINMPKLTDEALAQIKGVKKFKSSDDKKDDEKPSMSKAKPEDEEKADKKEDDKKPEKESKEENKESEKKESED